MVGSPLTLWAGKPTRLFLIGGINTPVNHSAPSLLHSRVLAHISLVRSNLQPNSQLSIFRGYKGIYSRVYMEYKELVTTKQGVLTTRACD